MRRPHDTVSGITVRHIGLEDPSVRPGGLNRYLADLVMAERREHLDAEGVVLGADGSQPSPGLIWAGSKDLAIWRRLMAMRTIARRRPLPDVVDAHFALYALLPLIGPLGRRPLVVHFQGPWAEESTTEGSGGINSRLKRWVERAVYRRADRVVVLSSAFEVLVSERYRVDQSVVRRIPPGVDTDRFVRGDKAAARAELGIDPETTFLVVAVRRLRNRMGLETAIEAISRCTLPGACLVIVGEGPERSRLEALAAELGAPVEFAGRVDDATLVTWYQAADVSVVPTVALEGFGLVVLESLACGTPVIASDIEGLRDALEGLTGAELVPSGDVARLVDVFDRVGTSGSVDPEACRRHAEAHGWEAVARRHHQLYAEVIDRPRPLTIFLGHTAVLSGGELALARLAPSLAERRRILVILAEDGPLVDRLRADGVEVEILPMDEKTRSMGREGVGRGLAQVGQAARAVRYSLRLAHRLRSLSPDQVHTNSLKAALYGGVAARLARVPCVIWHVRDRIADDYLPPRAVRLVRALARRVPDAVVANSSSTLATLGDVEVPTLVLASPLDPSIVDHDGPRGAGGLRLTLVGRLAPWKGQDLFLEAFASVFGGTDATARIVGSPLFGEDAFAEELEHRVDLLGLRSQVTLTGFSDDIAGELAATDVLVHCSRIAEPFGQVVIEGMGAGCCVVAADSGGPAESITDGVDGLLYATGSAADLARVLAEVAGDPDLRARLGRAGVITAERYRPDLLAAELEVFYDAVGRQR